MEKVFREYMFKKIDSYLATDGRFHFERKIKIGSERPGSTVWRWRTEKGISCFIVLEFYPNSLYMTLGIGFSKRKNGLLDFDNGYRAAHDAINQTNSNLDLLINLDEAYLYRTDFGHQMQDFGPIVAMASVERAKEIYKDKEILAEALDAAGYTEVDWEKNTMIRYWGIMSCYMKEPLSESDAEFAAGDAIREMIQFLETDGLPYLTKVGAGV